MITLFTILVFLAVLGLSFSLLAGVSATATRRHLFTSRLANIQVGAVDGDESHEATLLRKEVMPRIPFVDRIIVASLVLNRMQMALHQAGIEYSMVTFLLLILGCGFFGFLVGLTFGLHISVSGVLSAVVALIPILFVMFKRRSRLKKFEEQFPDGMDLLARAVRAGHAFTTGFELIADELPEPVAGEFRITFEQQNLGLPLTSALRNLSSRVPLPDVRIFVTTIQIQRESGGNLAEILEKLSFIIRERFKLLRSVRAKTAEGRMSLYVLTALPFFAAGLFWVTNPEYAEPLFVDPLGHKMLIYAVVSQIIGFLVIKRITTLKV